MNTRVVDADGHVIEPDSMWLDHLDAHLHAYAPRQVVDSQGRRRFIVGGTLLPYIPTPPPELWDEGGSITQPPWYRPGGSDPAARLADMDAEGIDVSVIFTSHGLGFACLDPPVWGALCCAYNDWIAEFCRYDRRRLIGVALVPQADLSGTIVEAQRAVADLGLRAVMLRPNPVAGRTIDDPSYEPVWSAIEELGVPLVLHEGTSQNLVQSGRDRFENFAFRHACSHPHEQQFACLALTCAGILERHPGLRVALVEAGCGWLPYWLQRLDDHMAEWSYLGSSLQLRPSEYFQRQCFVTCDVGERMLPAVVDLVGDGVVMFATDYPHPDSTFPGVVAALRDRTDLPADAKEKILGGNARRCFGLA